MAGGRTFPAGAFPTVAGRRDDGGWKVWISTDGVPMVLEPARARQLAQDILDMCGVVDGVHPALADGGAA